jgi:hypothetical protein
MRRRPSRNLQKRRERKQKSSESVDTRAAPTPPNHGAPRSKSHRGYVRARMRVWVIWKMLRVLRVVRGISRCDLGAPRIAGLLGCGKFQGVRTDLVDIVNEVPKRRVRKTAGHADFWETFPEDVNKKGSGFEVRANYAVRALGILRVLADCTKLASEGPLDNGKVPPSLGVRRTLGLADDVKRAVCVQVFHLLLGSETRSTLPQQMDKGRLLAS